MPHKTLFLLLFLVTCLPVLGGCESTRTDLQNIMNRSAHDAGRNAGY